MRDAPAYRPRVQGALAQLAAMDTFHRTLKEKMLGSGGIAIEAKPYFDEATAAINAVSSVNKVFSGIARDMLEQRIAAEMLQLEVLAGVALLAVGAAFYLFAGFSHGMRADVQQVASMVGRINAGDLAITLEVRGSDELSHVKRHLPSLVDTWRALIGDTKVGAQNVLVAAGEIAQGNLDLSQRTEEQARRCSRQPPAWSSSPRSCGRTPAARTRPARWRARPATSPWPAAPRWAACCGPWARSRPIPSASSTSSR